MGRPYGSEIGPNAPQQDMWAYELITNPPHDRSDDSRTFTGGQSQGNGEVGLGGHAEGGPDGDTRYDRIGY